MIEISYQLFFYADCFIAESCIFLSFTVTNTGTQVAHWVNTHVLFIKGGKVVDYTFETCSGEKTTEIQPGETVTTTVKPFIDGGFDDVMVFVHGTAYAH